jgi:hypothetical protein
MDKKQLIIRLLLAVFIIPLALALLVNALGFAAPGTVGGITMLLGVAYFIYWAKTNRKTDDHNNEQPTAGAP